MLSFDRLRQRIPLKCVPQVQHDYFSSLANKIIVSGLVVAVAVVLA